jgi:serine/threonine protein kinase
MKVDLLGKSLGRYKIVEVLGEGGMAKVYKGYDERLDRHVAIKVIEVRMFGSEELYKRFKREATALAQLSHPNIVNVHDYGEQEDGLPYLVMEFLGGGTLKDQIGEPMPYHEAAKTLTPIARALSYAHRHGFIHRDIKPANILLTEAGQPMLTDFGIAKKIQDEKSSITRSGMGLGTPDYMAPEQARTKNIDHRVDIYALGVVFFEMITGRKPFIAQTPGAVILKHSQEPFPSPAMFIPGLPPSVELVILKAV